MKFQSLLLHLAFDLLEEDAQEGRKKQKKTKKIRIQ